ncbi:MAG: ABC transporter substrate-binding protein [Synergistaceae bacterium]|jgi:ribose transport system substrate-binding protein|nr:ABC transporter substrate-binding protein [Synergistaceae bacterium]
MKKFLAVLLTAVIVISCAGSSGAAEKKWRIALSNDYAGNSWRQTMIRDFEAAAKIALEKGLIEEARIFTTNESSAAEQAAQLQNLILEGYDAILLNAASPTALNAAVKKAIDAGIIVVAFDNAISEESAYRLITDFIYDGTVQTEFLAKKFPDGANVLEIRGLSGTFVDETIHKGISDTLVKYPKLKVVGEVYGNWTGSVTQKEVAGILPSLPEVHAVATQGGDGYGALKAFEAAGRPIPLIIMGNRYDELEAWKDLLAKDPSYDTMSITVSPSVVQVAFWIAVEALGGQEFPKSINMPPLSIYKERLDEFLEKTEKGGVASISYPQEWVQQLIENAKAGKPAPADPQ